MAVSSIAISSSTTVVNATEQDPLLGSSSSAQPPGRTKKPWYRPRPLWLVPFAVTASLCRGMTMAPRTEVFTQLACEKLRPSRHHHISRHHHVVSLSDIHTDHYSSRFSLFTDVDILVPLTLDKTSIVQLSPVEEQHPSLERPDKHDVPVMDTPPIDCFADPAVQAGAAKLQTIMISIMGILSALTTGWWGQFGDRYGRTKVIASAISGLLFTDVMFILASNPPESLRGRAHELLIVAPIVEGLFGGWSTLQGNTHAYISDCTSHGSRANIYSRFTGVFYIGFALGPEIAAIILRTTHMTTLVFYASAVCASVNLFLLLFVFPESLGKEQRTCNAEAAQEARKKTLQETEGKTGLWRSAKSAVMAFVEPLGILGPKPRQNGRGKDWSLTLLAAAMFGFFLSNGLFQIKYLYAEHVFSWDAETLSYYITAVGSARALHLLLLLPAAIRIFKPAPKVPKSKSKSANKSKKAAPGPKSLISDIKFDLVVAEVSTILDICSHLLVALAKASSQELFVWFSMISSFGAGMVPALHSVAMSMLQLRRDEREENQAASGKGGAEVGKLFGAFAVMQATGSMILGPMLFGTTYGMTVAFYPKAVFLLASGLLVVSVALLLLIRLPRVDVPIEIRVETQVQVEVERLRGRSRKSKDISSSLR